MRRRGLRARVEKALAGEATDDSVFVELYDELDALEPEPSFPYEELSDLEAIRALRPEGPRRMDLDLADEAVRDRILGAWLGRAAGCSLGKPVEGWPRARIDKYLESTGALPLDNYIPYVEGSISPRLKASTRDNIEFMARDDDMDYPILGVRGRHPCVTFLAVGSSTPNVLPTTLISSLDDNYPAATSNHRTSGPSAELIPVRA